MPKINDMIRACVINPKNFSWIKLAIGSLKYRQAPNDDRLIINAGNPVQTIQCVSLLGCK